MSMHLLDTDLALDLTYHRSEHVCSTWRGFNHCAYTLRVSKRRWRGKAGINQAGSGFVDDEG